MKNFKLVTIPIITISVLTIGLFTVWKVSAGTTVFDMTADATQDGRHATLWGDSETTGAIGKSGLFGDLKGFFRFENVNIAQGATVTNATIDLVTGTRTGTPSLKVYAGDQDNAPDRTGGTVPTETSTTTTWSPATGSTTYNIDITDSVQEVINRPGWVSGNAMEIAFINLAGGYPNTIVVSFTEDTGNEPTLSITTNDAASTEQINIKAETINIKAGSLDIR